MKNYRINPDKKYVNVIMEGLQRKNGHCPCRVNEDDTTLCPCDEFIGMQDIYRMQNINGQLVMMKLLKMEH